MQWCSEPGCSVLVRSGKCPAHAPRDRYLRQDYRTIHRWQTSTRWLRLRLEVLQDQPLCRDCLKAGRKTPSQDVDHIIKHDGDVALFWDRRNLQGLCRACHTQKTVSGQ